MNGYGDYAVGWLGRRQAVYRRRGHHEKLGAHFQPAVIRAAAE